MGKFTIGLAAFASLLSACDSDVPPPASEQAATGQAVEASGAGVVTEVVLAEGTITIEHGEMPELKWPPMTMAFAAPPDLVAGVSPGDEVTFELSVEDGRGRITALARRAAGAAGD